MIGTTVSRYRILSKLGGGGMGVVYEAEDPELGRRVAIKFLPEATASSADVLERFKREARAASALDHPHICVIHDVGTHEGQPYLVMERLKGRALKHVIGSGGMPVDEVVKLGEQIADALDAAHHAGIVHRDLKPANLFVTERGDAKVLDFGLAKMSGPEATGPVTADGPTFEARHLTRTGATLGTAAYMSPEQARGRPVDARSDLFSLGVVLYEMATGRLPFQGQSTADFFAAILRTEPRPPRELKPEIPERLEEVILKALEKDPALRYQTAAGLRGDLLRLQRDTSGASRADAPAASTRDEETSLKGKDSSAPRRALWLGVGAVAVVAALGLGWFATRGGAPGGAEGVGKDTAAAGAASPTSVAAAPEKSIAVLPFVDMSQAKDQEYFSDGISEELLNLLTKIPDLKVTARTSSFSFKGRNVEIPEIARQLGVAHVLEGSVRKSGDQIRITAQLVHAADGFHLWSETYDRTLDDVFKVQDEIAAKVVAELKVTLLDAVPKARMTDPQAYALFLQAKELGRQHTAEALEKSDALFRQTLEIDPLYAQAWSELARNVLHEVSVGVLSTKEGHSRAREALEQALAVDPDYAPAYASLGWIAMYDNDFAGAAKQYERALALDSTDLDVLRSVAGFLTNLGRPDEALALEESIVRRDPVNLAALNNLGIDQRCTGRYDAAITSFRTVLRRSPGWSGARCQLGLVLMLNGDAPAALAEIEQETSEMWRMIALPLAYHALGRPADSDAALAALIAKYGMDAPYGIAYDYAFRGEADKAFEWLDKAVEYGDGGLADIVTENLFDKIRSDPRWLPFLRKLGKAPEQLAKIEFQITLPQE